MVTPDFVRIVKNRVGNRSDGEIYQMSIDFNVGHLRDVVIQGGNFTAFYNYDTHFWESKASFYKYARALLYEEAEKERQLHPDQTILVQDPQHLSSKVPTKIDALCKACETENAILFNQKIFFHGELPEREDYATKTMPYERYVGNTDEACPNYDELMSVLYSPEDRTMIEWLAGCALCGDGDRVDKFIYLEGEPGSGKSTILNIVEQVLGPYGASIKAEEFASSNSPFATAQMKKAPLLGIQHDGDLSKIETNTILNNIISHEPIEINEKYAKTFYIRLRTLLIIASNNALRLTDSYSGLLRRALDPVPTGKLIPNDKYNKLVGAIQYELAGICARWIDVYRSLGTRAYGPYRSTRIVRNGNALGYWVERNRDIEWSRSGECYLSTEYSLYRAYCDGTSTKPISKSLFERQLHFFWEMSADETQDNSVKDVHFMDYAWKRRAFTKPVYRLYVDKSDTPKECEFLSFTVSSDAEFAKLCSECPAQYATESGTPKASWDTVTTKLSNIVSTELHYVRPQLQHIVIDLDCRDSGGGKSLNAAISVINELGLPPTYGELSKSGQGVHLHYIYDGDPTTLTNLIRENVEVKVFVGKSSLRRKFSYSNGLPVSHVSSGIPLKDKKEDVAGKEIEDEDHLRNIIKKGLRGEYGSHIVTIQFIDYMLKKAVAQGLVYDLESYRVDLMAYALKSTHHANELPAVVEKMPLHNGAKEKPIIIFDFEVFPNYNCLGWKIKGEKQRNIERFPSPQTLQDFLDKYRIAGFNNLGYDNIIWYTLMQGASPYEVYKVSKAIITRDKSLRIPRSVKSLSYTDIYDFCNTKQSLKKWEVQLGIHHQECPYDWDQPLPEEAWDVVDRYCLNDVEASEAVWDANENDWVTRQLLAFLTGMTVNDTTNSLTAKLIFGEDTHPQSEFIYTDLSDTFPGYAYEVKNGKCVSYFHGRTIGEGGYVVGSPGWHTMVGVRDVESMHPTSTIELGLFGKYTARYKYLVDVRKAAKNGREEEIKAAYDGRLYEFMTEKNLSYKTLSKSLKVPINAVYGCTSAKFDNIFKDPRNVDNIVAKRGELMMVSLEDELRAIGVAPTHVKTDSIKLDNYTQELDDKVVEFGKKYGYKFTIEEFYTTFCLFDKAQYIAYDACTGKWDSRGKLFDKNGLVFKKLFGLDVKESDYLETKQSLSGPLYIGDQFVGKNANIVFVKEQYGKPMSCKRDDKFVSVTGTKGLFVMEYEEALQKDFWNILDYDYYDSQVEKAKAMVEKYVPWDVFVSHAHDPIPDIPCLEEINEAIRKRGYV